MVPRFLVASSLILSGCAGVAPVGSGADCAASADFSGEWDSNWGPLWLEQSGSRVTGQYYADRRGRLEGAVCGSDLTFNWKEGGLSGRGRFSMAPGGAAYSGSFRMMLRNYAWNGSRKTAPREKSAPERGMAAAAPAESAEAAAEPKKESEPAYKPKPKPEFKPDPSLDDQL